MMVSPVALHCTRALAGVHSSRKLHPITARAVILSFYAIYHWSIHQKKSWKEARKFCRERPQIIFGATRNLVYWKLHYTIPFWKLVYATVRLKSSWSQNLFQISLEIISTSSTSWYIFETYKCYDISVTTYLVLIWISKKFKNNNYAPFCYSFVLL